MVNLFLFCSVTSQVAGRNVILFVIFGSLEDMQNKPVVFFVFYLWSTIEIFRSARIPVLPRSAERLFLPAVTSTLPSPHQVSFLHAGLHQHRVEAVDVAEIQPLDPSVPAGGCGRRLVITFTGKAEALTTVRRYLLLTVCRSVLVSSGGRDPVPAHL